MSKEFILKKNIFGGFDRRQVIDYLAHLQEKCADSNNKSEIEKTRLQIKTYLEKIEEKNKKIEDLKNELQSLKALSETPVANVFKSLEEADKIVSSAKKEVEQHIRSASENVSESNEKFNLLISRVDVLKAELANIGSKADTISSKISKIEVEEFAEDCAETAFDTVVPEAVEPVAETAETIAAETFMDYPDDSEDYEETSILPFVDSDDEILTVANSIDNFFTELEKLTGSADFYDNRPDIDKAFDKSKKILPDDNNGEKDEAFDDMLKNIFHESKN